MNEKISLLHHFDFTSVRRVVVKVGTSTLTYGTGMINLRRMEEIVKVLSDLKNAGKELVLVSSGAVSAGFAKMGMVSEKTVPLKQAAAAVGQCVLMNLYDRLFSQYGHTVAQILVTKEVVDDPVRLENARNTFRTLLECGCIPIVNENDSVSSEGIRFGGNDTLSAYVAGLTGAELLVNMSDVDGLYDKNPREFDDAKLIRLVTRIDSKIEQSATGAGTVRGTGGMRAKLEAAKISLGYGTKMVIVNSCQPSILYDVFDGIFVGTLFV